jgi:hypothetical protein
VGENERRKEKHRTEATEVTVGGLRSAAETAREDTEARGSINLQLSHYGPPTEKGESGMKVPGLCRNSVASSS